MDRNDPFSYLSRAGLGKTGVSKSAAKIGGDRPKMRAISAPMPNARKLRVKEDKMQVSGSTHGKGALGSMSIDRKGLAQRANIEGNESKMYEKLEKRTTKSLKEGGSEKELRRGHNFSGLVGLFGGGGDDSKPKKTGPSKKQLAKPEWREKHSVAAAKGDLKATKKAGGDVGMAKQGLAAAKGERKTVFKEIKAARKDIKQGPKSIRPQSKAILKAAKQEAKTKYAGKYNKMQAERKARKSGDGGGGFSGLAGLF